MKLRHILFSVILLLAAGSAGAQGFVFKDMQGQTQRLSDYRGKWVMVNFWATWCPPCLEEIPELVALHNAHKDRDLVVLGVALESKPSSVKELAARMGITYPLVMGTYKMAEQIGEVDVLPTSYLYAPNGELVSYQAGALTRESVETYIKSNKLN
jgi:thiol-disulfide isomerase/thioredoxin